MDAVVPKIFIFECSANTYVECLERSLFGSNANWPEAISSGDICLLHHYDSRVVLGAWIALQVGKNLQPKAWKGRFPWQAEVRQISEEIFTLEPQCVGDILDPSNNRIPNALDQEKSAIVYAAIAGQINLS